jgi:hypothetical protein
MTNLILITLIGGVVLLRCGIRIVGEGLQLGADGWMRQIRSSGCGRRTRRDRGLPLDVNGTSYRSPGLQAVDHRIHALLEFRHTGPSQGRSW